ncbi:MAG TPA: molybdenum ABC transporter ATP-binding protein [Azoarcus sp.]|nr:molybdenum ABC transporter ATP-binding protein [Azoarcus sp.]
MTIAARFYVDRGAFVLDVDVQLPSRGVTALFGKSGSGKTTILRCMAGLEQPDKGHVVFNGEVWQDAERFVPPHQRRIGYVFQEASLFPHLTARGNLRYGWKRTPLAERRIDEDEIVALLDIEPLLGRYPDQLSGGERQRVALGRAMLTSPSLLLLDEPLSALDRERKREILPYLERLRDELAMPMLYVSHSHDEVIRLADHLVLIEDGRVQANGPLAEVLVRTDLSLSADAEASVMIEAEIVEHDEQWHLSRLVFSGGELWVPRSEYAPGHSVRVRVHARDVSLTLEKASGTSINNLIHATVTSVVELEAPTHALVRLDANGTSLLARITRRSSHLLGLEPGRTVWAQIKSMALLD